MIDLIFQYTFKEVGQLFENCSFYKSIFQWEDDTKFNLRYVKLQRQDEQVWIEVQLKINTEKWNKPYSILQMSETFEKVIKSENLPYYKYYPPNNNTQTNQHEILFLIEKVT